MDPPLHACIVQGWDILKREEQAKGETSQRGGEGGEEEGGGCDTSSCRGLVVLPAFVVTALVVYGIVELLSYRRQCDVWGEWLGLCGLLWFVYPLVGVSLVLWGSSNLWPFNTCAQEEDNYHDDDMQVI